MSGERNAGCWTALATAAVTVAWYGLSPAVTRGDEPAASCGPSFVSVDPIGGKVLVLCQKRSTIARVDPQTGSIEAEASVGDEPFALCRHPDGRRLYVSCRRGQEVVELDVESLSALRHFPVRGDPTGVAVSADGLRLYVGVHSMDQVAVLDLASGREVKRLAAGNGPETVRLSQHRGLVYVTNLLSNPVSPDEPCRNEITVIDDSSARVIDRIILENANVGRDIDFSSDGSLAVTAISRPKNLVPMLQVARGWVVTNGFALLGPPSDGPPVQLLVDLPNRAFADPHAVAFGPGDKRFYVSCAGADTVIAVDVQQTQQVIEEATLSLIPRPADNLGLSRRYVTSRIAVGHNPQAMALSHDGRWLFVANRLDDTVSVIDTTADAVVRTLVLGDAALQDTLARGERIFHSAARTFQEQFTCVSCHPDRGFDGLQYDLEPDGIGRNLLDNRNLRGVAGTAPFKWVGSNPDITTQCGTRTAKWIMRTGWLTSVEVVHLARYIRSIKSVINPYRPAHGGLTASQRRGKALFDRTTTNDGRPIAERDRCNSCHSGPKFCDGQQSDVGTRHPGDTAPEFDSAHLTNIFDSSPYLHDGRAATLEEVWTRHNPEDKHGISSDWNKQQLNDLVEYLKSL